MERFVKLLKKLYWLGLLGFAGTFFHIPHLQLFYLFFLLAFVDFVLSFILVLKTDEYAEARTNLKFLCQNLGMLLGIPLIYVRNRFRLPDVNTYKPQVRYSLPFQGKWTVANGGTDRETSHSWRICNQRYAYDFYIEENGSTFQGDGKSVTDYFAYGKPVLAPADGKVAELTDLFEDTPIPENNDPLCSASDIRGNYIVIQHAPKEFTTIAHLKKDSFSVRTGDRVTRGQQIALCGNSGNTTEPHIHFQVQQGKSFALSASLPVTFTGITISPHIRRGQEVENQKG